MPYIKNIGPEILLKNLQFNGIFTMPPLAFWALLLAGMGLVAAVVSFVILFIHFTTVATTVFACFCVFLIGYILFSK